METTRKAHTGHMVCEERFEKGFKKAGKAQLGRNILLH